MNEPNFTPGPWFFAVDRFNNPEHDDKIGSIVDDQGDFVLAEICGDVPKARGNAHLLAAAPEMYEALKALLADKIGWHGTGTLIGGEWKTPAADVLMCEFCGEANPDSMLIAHTPNCLVTKARAALAKAEGRGAR